MPAKTKAPIARPSEFQPKTEIWAIDRVIPYPLNNKQHPPEQIAKLAGMIKTFGWDVPIVVDDGGIILKGHCRRLAAIQLGLLEVPVIVRRELSEADKRALRIADNKISESPYDDEALRAEIAALAELDYDLSLTGFEESELNLMLDGLDFGEGEDEEAIAPEEDEAALQDLEEDLEAAESGAIEVRVKPGEIWRLGRHFICCGDSTDEANVKRLMKVAGVSAIELLFTSPPYSDMRTYKKGTDVSLEKICSFIPAWANHANYLAINLGLKFQDSEVCLYWDQYVRSAKDCGLKFLAWNVWDKQQAGSIAHATNMFCLSHEWIFVFGDKKKKLNRTVPNQIDKYKSRDGASILESGKTSRVRQADGTVQETSSKAYAHHQLHSVIQAYPELSNTRKLHPAVYPIALPTQYYEAMTAVCDTIADPFLGSGTSIIAAQQMEGDRTVLGFELSAEYCEIICRRFERLSGINAELVGHLPQPT